MDKATVLAEREGEFATERVIRIGDDYFAEYANGGSRGAWDPQNNTCKFGCQPISRAQARALCMACGLTPEETAEATD